MINSIKFSLLSVLLAICTVAQAGCDWPAWQQFKQHYIDEQGRVIDPNSPNHATTSEGQSYALFFALVANDQTTFNHLLQWTENNLAQGDLTLHLPAWLWGENQQKEWTVIDHNSASDADLWLAYSLLEAGRLWNNKHYQSIGISLVKRIANEEVVNLIGLGDILLPGKYGFANENDWRLNPSYAPLQILSRFSRYGSPWKNMVNSQYHLLLNSAPKGFSPNWIIWNRDQTWSYDKELNDIGSYDAIRVYLWVGMLADNDKRKLALISRFQPMIDWVDHHGTPPETVLTANAVGKGVGPVGFSAALLPLLQSVPSLNSQRQRVTNNPVGQNEYYNYVLTLFGQGWDEQRYRFNLAGELLPIWSHKCAITH